MKREQQEELLTKYIFEAKTENKVITYSFLEYLTGIHRVKIGSILSSTQNKELQKLSPYVVGQLGDFYFIKTINKNYTSQLNELEINSIPVFDYSSTIEDIKTSEKIRKSFRNEPTETKRFIPETFVKIIEISKKAA